MKNEKTCTLSMHDKELGILRFSPSEGYIFTYADFWLRNGFPLSPHLPLVGTEFRQWKLFAPFLDAAPESWGRRVLMRAEALEAHRNNRARTLLDDFDHLVRADNATRAGAIEVRHETSVPEPVFTSPDYALVLDFEKDMSGEGIYQISKNGIAPGGARPKTSVMRDGELWLAKTKSIEDSHVTAPLWEAVNLTLAEKCGLNVATTEYDADAQVLLSKRFDRRNGQRIHYASARTLLEIDRDEVTSYAHIAGTTGMDIEDRKEMFKRIVLNIIVANYDDHLCNIGFLHDGERFRLSPLFDVQSMPDSLQAPFSHTMIAQGNHVANPDTALKGARELELDHDWAISTILSMNKAIVASWQDIAAELSAPVHEISFMENVYNRFRDWNPPIG